MADPRPPILYSSVHLLGRQKFVRKLCTRLSYTYIYIYISRRKEEYKFMTHPVLYMHSYIIYTWIRLIQFLVYERRHNLSNIGKHRRRAYTSSDSITGSIELLVYWTPFNNPSYRFLIQRLLNYSTCSLIESASGLLAGDKISQVAIALW